MRQIILLGDSIKDTYYLCRHLGIANEDPCPKLKKLERLEIMGGIHFIWQSIQKQIELYRENSIVLPSYKQSSYTEISRYLDHLSRKNFLTIEDTHFHKDQDPSYTTVPPYLYAQEKRKYFPNDVLLIWDDGKSPGRWLRSEFREGTNNEVISIVDCSTPDIFDRYPAATVYKVSSQEARSISWNDLSPTSIAIITGPEIVTMRHNGNDMMIPVPHIEDIIDTIGAGDVFLARMTFLIAIGKSVEHAIREAIWLASESIRYPYCHFPLGELLKGRNTNAQ